MRFSAPALTAALLLVAATPAAAVYPHMVVFDAGSAWLAARRAMSPTGYVRAGLAEAALRCGAVARGGGVHVTPDGAPEAQNRAAQVIRGMAAPGRLNWNDVHEGAGPC